MAKDVKGKANEVDKKIAEIVAERVRTKGVRWLKKIGVSENMLTALEKRVSKEEKREKIRERPKLSPQEQRILNAEFIEAAKRGDLTTMEDLLDIGADITAKDNAQGRTALICASFDGHEEVVEFLIKLGANVNATDKDGQTAIIAAVNRGYKTIVESLIKHGADVNARNNDGETALIWNSHFGNMGIAELLIKNGADLTIKDNHDATAREVAHLYGKYDMEEFLMKEEVKKEAEELLKKKSRKT